MYEDRLEFTSIGGLVTGVTLEDVMMGISVCRNKKLANVFYRLELIEAYGTGIQKIMNAYQDQFIKPEIKVSNNVFKIILPNTNAQAELREELQYHNTYTTRRRRNTDHANDRIKKKEFKENKFRKD